MVSFRLFSTSLVPLCIIEYFSYSFIDYTQPNQSTTDNITNSRYHANKHRTNILFLASDVMARYWRMTSHDVLHPIGWDSFGLPAEQFAINTGTHPEVTTIKNINNFRRQLQMLGFSYDWEKELATTDINYVKWTQWIFLKLYERGLAQQSSVNVNWCPALGTVLANEEVINGLSERGDHPVVRMPLRQWVLKITEYADRLQKGLEGLDWPAGTMVAQEQWIGKSEGTEIDFVVDGLEENKVRTL